MSRLAEYGIADLTAGEIALIKRGGYQTLNEVANCIASIRQLPSYDPSLLIFKKSDKDKTKTGLSLAREKLENQKDWDPERLQQVLQSIPTEHSLTNGDVFWPIRVALSGAEKSPSPAELLFALGKNESLARINQAVASIEKL
ncbi:MAG: Glutamate--tRNA ligase [bacterium ADurb.Bin400]|nr:MAG: Glutamate--tRNA ligase [bacterium ADurb.Bin400]